MFAFFDKFQRPNILGRAKITGKMLPDVFSVHVATDTSILKMVEYN